ncbi:biopolymer transporter ExbD [Bartonella taylorii]|uniref:Biopolymer transporter ExbD n=1 Tax=Bartonella taylorii TaxID=33046 RepID=A0A9Q8YX41_BARTA|nr:biopolymer transporter ExbD [Bartonella taylorii]OPB35133.1 outer membrane transport energization protein ExbD [Bartonella taylorii]USP02287.1 biopolymer transporter ExbD [Bartonella taylorii]
MKANFNDHWDTDEGGLHSEINVTPFIDVVLVLLIVFMVAAPLATSVIPVQLPSITQAPSVVQPDQPLYVTLQKDRSLYVCDNLVNQAVFTEALLKETNRNLETKILIKADSEIDYGAVVDLLNQIRTAGYTKVGLMGLQKSSNVVAKGVVSDGTAVATDAVGENVTSGAGTATSDVVNANTSAMGTVSPVE